MKYTAEEVYYECLKQFTGIDGREPLGGISVDDCLPGTLADKAAAFFRAAAAGKNPEAIFEGTEKAAGIAAEPGNSFIEHYKPLEDTDFFIERADIIFTSDSPLTRARSISELWSPEITLDNDEIYNSWLLTDVKPNPLPYAPGEVIIQLNALYSPAGSTAPGGVSPAIAEKYNSYMESRPEKIAVYDHPVPVFTRGSEHELEKCLIELDADIDYEKKCGVFETDSRLIVLISISTTHKDLDTICEMWLREVLSEYKLDNIACYLLSENKARNLGRLIGSEADIFTVQGKYACHFGALKYAQLLFEKARGIRAGFKLDTDEGIHSRDMKTATGKTWFEQLCHPYWGGTAVNSRGKEITLGFNIGEYVDSRDLDALGFAKAICTPEVKLNDDLRGPYLLFNKGACQAKGTALLNRGEKLEDFISHPLVKGGGYGIDNAALRKAVPVGFSMVGRAEDQQFYYSALNSGCQGIFNPKLRIIHYKAAVAKSEHKHKAGTSIADIYRMLLFRELMSNLDVIEATKPFPANYASDLSSSQVVLLWYYLIFKASAEGDEEAAREYLNEGLKELPPLLEEIKSGKLIRRFEMERAAWQNFSIAVDEMDPEDASSWLESLKI